MSGVLATQEITNKCNSKSGVHRVDPLAGLCAVFLMCASLDFIISIVASSTFCILKERPIDVGLWILGVRRACSKVPGGVPDRSTNSQSRRLNECSGHNPETHVTRNSLFIRSFKVLTRGSFISIVHLT